MKRSRLKRIQNELLHISTFFVSPTVPPRDDLEYHLQLFASLDIFATRGPDTPDGNYNLLFATDPRLAFFGFLSPTNIKYVVGVDMEGKSAPEQAALEGGTAKSSQQQPSGIKYQDLQPAFAALRKAYARLLRDPFYETDEEDEEDLDQRGSRNGKIKSRWFEAEVDRIGQFWYPGIAAL